MSLPFPQGLTALQLGVVNLELADTLRTVLLDAGAIELKDERPEWRMVQRIRYACGSPELARLVRIQIDTPRGRREITPAGAQDDIPLEFLMAPRETMTVRLVRGPRVEAAALPDPLPAAVVRLEVLG